MGKDLKGKDIGRGFSQRKDGRYEARAMVNGCRIDMYGHSLAELKKEFELEKTKIYFSMKQKTEYDGCTVGQWYGEWFKKCKSKQLKSEVSIVSYDRKIRNTYIRLLDETPIKFVTQIMIQQATNQLTEESYSARVIKDALGVLRECLDGAVFNKIIDMNPCQQILVENKNEYMKERRVLEKWEQDMLLDEVKDSYYAEVYQFLLLTGLRIGEFSGLQWNDIDFEKRIIKIRRSMQTAYIKGKKIEQLTTPKTHNSYRNIPFFGETESILKSWRIKQSAYRQSLGNRWRAKPEHGDLVFTTTFGSPVTRYVLVHDIKRVENNLQMREKLQADAEGRNPRTIEHIYPHCFRHTFATRCFEKGMSPVVIQDIMGHSSYSTTLTYTHVLDEKRAEEIKMVGNFLA